MVTTQGYRDIIHIGRHQRPHHFSIQQEIPWQDRPLIRRQHRKVVPERLIPPRGEVLIPLDEEAVRELKGKQVESIVVCFLFSYLNASHENRAREIIIEEYRVIAPNTQNPDAIRLGLLADGLSVSTLAVVLLLCTALALYSIRYIEHRIEILYVDEDQVGGSEPCRLVVDQGRHVVGVRRRVDVAHVEASRTHRGHV